MTQQQRYVPVHELARRLSCSSRTVRREIAKGAIPAVKVGRVYRVDVEAAIRALQQPPSNSGRGV